MAVYAMARDKRFAGMVLTLAFETLGDLELDERSLTEDEAKAITVTASVAAICCGGSPLSTEEIGQQATAYQAWWQKNETTVADVGETLIAAAETLKTHWTGSSTDKKMFLKGMLMIALGDGTITDNEKTTMSMIASVMNATDELGAALQEFVDG